MPQRRDDSILTLFSVAEAPEVDDIAGVWATDVRMAVTANDLTLDFIREDPLENLKAEQRRKYPHLAAIKFPPKERE
jgi:hypothetical protein